MQAPSFVDTPSFRLSARKGRQTDFHVLKREIWPVAKVISPFTSSSAPARFIYQFSDVTGAADVAYDAFE
jgi:hypothetical protein